MQNTSFNPFPNLPGAEEMAKLAKADWYWKALEFEAQQRFSSINIFLIQFPQLPHPELIDVLPQTEPNP
jgi:hypothetical protein